MPDINMVAYKSSIALKMSLFFMVMERSMLLVFSEVYSTNNAAYACSSAY